MLHLASVCVGLLAVLGGDAFPSPRDLQTYEALMVKAGKDPQAQVKLALWCEAHGLDAERLKHWPAVLSDPANATARGLLGLVAHGGRWESPEKIVDRVKADIPRAAGLSDYDGRQPGWRRRNGTSGRSSNDSGPGSSRRPPSPPRSRAIASCAGTCQPRHVV